jgi:hypothetical protein
MNSQETSEQRTQNDKYTKERVTEVIARVKRIGGLPIPPGPLYQFQSLFRTIAKRGGTSVEFLNNRDLMRRAYREQFPNPMTRSQYIRGFLMYLTGLTDEEFSDEFPGLSREDVVHKLQAISTEANKERRTTIARSASEENADIPT